MFRDIVGRDLTEKEHAMLKVMLQNFKNTVAPVPDRGPIEHAYTCKECGGVESGYGMKYKMKMNRIRPPKKKKDE